MTAMQMNAELFRAMGVIAEDEGLMTKLLKYAKKHRLVYRIFEQEVIVLVLTAYGHYDDK